MTKGKEKGIIIIEGRRLHCSQDWLLKKSTQYYSGSVGSLLQALRYGFAFNSFNSIDHHELRVRALVDDSHYQYRTAYCVQSWWL